jgi:hypothetical protein
MRSEEMDRLLAPFERQLEALREGAATCVAALCARHLTRISKRLPGRKLTMHSYIHVSVTIDPPVRVGDRAYDDLRDLIEREPKYFGRNAWSVKEDFDAMTDHVEVLERRMGCIPDTVVVDPDADIEPTRKAA